MCGWIARERERERMRERDKERKRDRENMVLVSRPMNALNMQLLHRPSSWVWGGSLDPRSIEAARIAARRF